MENKGNETTKTIIAVVLLAAMAFLIYWQFFMPQETTEGEPPFKMPGQGEQVSEEVAKAEDMPDPEAVFSNEALGGGDAVGTLIAGTSFVMHGEKYVPGLPGEDPVKLPMHAELAPEDYFSTERYYEVKENEDKFIYSVQSADKLASGKLGEDGDKAFAGGAYFTSIDEMAKSTEMRNPFLALIAESTERTNPSIGTGTPTTSTSRDIWGDFRIPWSNGGTPSNGERNGTDQGVSLPVYEEGTLVIDGGIVKVKGIALSSHGASALLEINYQGERIVIRVRTGQNLEGRYQVADIQRNMVIVFDNLTGQTFELELKLGERTSV